MNQKHPKDKVIKMNEVIPIRSHPELDKIIPLSYKDIVNSNPPPREIILHPWLPQQGLAFIYAASGVGKTLFTLNVAYAIASGGNFLKYKCLKPRRVLYVDGEMAYIDVYSRFMQIIKQQGPLEDDNFFLLNPEKSSLKLPKISSPEGQAFYNKKMDDLNIEVLVLDNLSTLSSIEENSSEEWLIIQDWLIDLRSRGKTVIVVHHAGKDKKGYRGSSRMLDVLDAAISLQASSQDQLENEMIATKKFKIEYQKYRSFGGADILPFEVGLSPHGWEFQSMEQTNIERIAERLNIKMTHKDIAIELGVSRPYITKIAKKARSMGLLRDE